MTSRSDQQLETAAQEVFLLLQELLRAYQFRDVSSICSHGVSLTECHILDLLATSNGLGVKDLAASLGLDKSTTSRAVDALLERKLVRKHANQTDARSIRVDLTAAGKKRHQAIVAASVASYSRVLAAVPAADRDEILAGFRKLVALLRQREPAC